MNQVQITKKIVNLLSTTFIYFHFMINECSHIIAATIHVIDIQNVLYLLS